MATCRSSYCLIRQCSLENETRYGVLGQKVQTNEVDTTSPSNGLATDANGRNASSAIQKNTAKTWKKLSRQQGNLTEQHYLGSVLGCRLYRVTARKKLLDNRPDACHTLPVSGKQTTPTTPTGATPMTAKMTKQQATDHYGVNVNGLPLAVDGFWVRTDKGTFEHRFEAMMSLDEAKPFVQDMTRGHKVLDGPKYIAAFGHGSYFTD